MLKNILKILVLGTSYLVPLHSSAQPGFLRTDTIKVFNGSNVQLVNPWAGGHNFPQFSAVDLDGDGIMDLVVFDRSGDVPYDKLTTYLNIGTPNQVSYVHAPQYEKKFPFLHDWALMLDYNCDGKADIFTYNNADFSVYKNTSTTGNLQFTLVKSDDSTDYIPHNSSSKQKLYVSPTDIPAFADVDNDGDIDVITYEISGTKVEYHKNMSMENYGNCDHLEFYQDAGCWGHFTESFSSNAITLNSCTGRMSADSTVKYSHDPTPQHSGNCLACFDLDGDRDKDLVNGSLNYCNLNGMINGGDTVLAVMTSDDPNYPSNSVPVNQVLFPCPFHVDVNNDGKRDLLVSPNAPNVSENLRSIIYYMNTGTDASPVFVFQQNDFLQDNMIDVGEGAYPVLFDYDADGLTDILIGNNYSEIGPGCTGGTKKVSVTAYRNTGTSTAPKFQYVTNDYASLSTILTASRNLMLTFGDLDGDGDMDMIVGDDNGRLHRFQNTAGAGNPAVFAQQMPADMLDNANNAIDVGQNAAPQLFDLNKDGLLDLVIGERSGKIYYYRNTGTANNPVFTLGSNNLGSIDVMPGCCTGYACPVLFSDSGSTEMFVGSEQGYIFHYTNIDGNLTGNFTKLDSMFWKSTEAWEGMRVAPTLMDITGDGLMDMVVGNYRGGLAFYKGDMSTGISGSAYRYDPSVYVYPNPAGNSFTIKLEDISYKDARLLMYDAMGRQVMDKRPDGMISQVDVSFLPDGLYLCVVQAGGAQAVRKVVIRH